MKKLILFISFLSIGIYSTSYCQQNTTIKDSSIQEFYKQLNIPDLDFKVFQIAIEQWVSYNESNQFESEMISIIDFSQPSTNKRYYLINTKDSTLAYQNYVAHGRNSGVLFAKSFSNIPNSNQSSLGVYKTAETYYGKHGLSLRIDGLQPGLNDKARTRHIVIHAADYAEEKFINKYGRLGRSYGCPALPFNGYPQVIEKIKGGSFLFIYHPSWEYHKTSFVIP